MICIVLSYWGGRLLQYMCCSNSVFIMMFRIITVNLLCKPYKFIYITRFVMHDSLIVSGVTLTL